MINTIRYKKTDQLGSKLLLRSSEIYFANEFGFEIKQTNRFRYIHDQNNYYINIFNYHINNKFDKIKI